MVTEIDKKNYEEKGYVVIKGFVPNATIDNFLSIYKRKILKSKKKFFRNKINKYERNKITEFGYAEQSFLDVHNWNNIPEFKETILDILLNPEMQDALKIINGFSSHKLMQSMFFDLNTETVGHQDYWYLDSVPGGHLMGAWIACENIKKEAGRFFVLEGTHKLSFYEEGISHEIWLEKIKNFIDKNPRLLKAPKLNKGDLLLWNSKLIHGAEPIIDKKFSRKSITAHFLPEELDFGNLFTKKEWVKFGNHNGYKYFANQPEYSRKAAFASSFKQFFYNRPKALSLLRKIQRMISNKFR